MIFSVEGDEKKKIKSLAKTSNDRAILALTSILPQHYIIVEPGNKLKAYDLEIRDINKNNELVMLVEVKDRKFESTKYDTTILEEEKLNSLAGHSIKRCVPVIYLNLYTDNVAASWKVLDSKGNNIVNEYTAELKCMNAATFRSTTKVWKLVRNLPLEKAKKWNF